jgi:glutamine amidotransferase
MTVIIDYGVGNLFSLKSSFGFIGEEAIVSGDRDVIKNADRLVLPGVGAFEDAAKKLKEAGLFELIKSEANSGKPLMGICLGMQMLFDKSLEYGVHEGLGLIPGVVSPIGDVIPEGLKIPQIGWNALRFHKNENNEVSPLFKYISEGDFVYFVHSYYAANCEPYVIADTEYGAYLTAAVARDNVYGCQFHPEKSGNVGLNILRSFCELK